MWEEIKLLVILVVSCILILGAGVHFSRVWAKCDTGVVVRTTIGFACVEAK